MIPRQIHLLIKKLSKYELIKTIDLVLGRPVKHYNDYIVAILFAKNTDFDVVTHMVHQMPSGGLASAYNIVLSDSCDIGEDGLYPPNVEYFLKLRRQTLFSDNNE